MVHSLAMLEGHWALVGSQKHGNKGVRQLKIPLHAFFVPFSVDTLSV